ncbi:hypothetical protein K469DRAFT_776327 [Zopfia rhizophila CBS 207.26]|uniref:Uncharacterized protein n=1 Tax=Zopfia rhizophila CBS 207.26 TaxID=1314779 RepID=A0A6A6E399_9PEZI|nr:hypothetical protein K469DRAFT_776327 [Zopfia rhizophila CBS 207.26]
MAGRIHLQHALSVIFGYKYAVYLFCLLRPAKCIEEIERRWLVQFGGAAGILASLGSDDTDLRVRTALAEELGLQNPKSHVT